MACGALCGGLQTIPTQWETKRFQEVWCGSVEVKNLDGWAVRIKRKGNAN